MSTAVISGGTDGIGRALADVYLRRGHEVVVIGRSRAKGDAFVAAGGDRAHFLPVDLRRVGEVRRLVDHLAERFPAIDALVLGARFCSSRRVVTPDGFESNFALFYLSRFLLSHGLAPSLGRAADPVVLNFGGAGAPNAVRWDDLQLAHGYHGVRAMGHAARLNDLLAVSFSALHAELGVRYVLNHPGVVVTSFAGEYDAVTAAQVEQLKVTGKSVATSVAQILPYLDAGEDRVTAVHEGVRRPLDPAHFDPADAMRLHTITEGLLARAPR
ncbi:SDR family NAD(P)-dependent oxidoreductase [Cryptosporangium aurantiacum]|uniref:Short-chain dehydrogenase n=1 Tax=Cryptosporangium aurantiacum TaxID=134849 RepID=A0A1M7RK49_9ACTN|nr:SDR family NAD(P)-dependent oxidoreductase [Cryptosporangium aurantiacum]SHN46644.1 Short-chain dehydrogenase [Cryptosporangium aurantiacum]